MCNGVKCKACKLCAKGITVVTPQTVYPIEVHTRDNNLVFSKNTTLSNKSKNNHGKL